VSAVANVTSRFDHSQANRSVEEVRMRVTSALGQLGITVDVLIVL
jgi:hypothetical protein